MENEFDLSKIPSPDLFEGLTPEEKRGVMEIDSIKVFPKGHHLIKEGNYFTHSFFVVNGCVRQYMLVDGEEKTSNFYTENQTIYLPASVTKVPSKFSLQCLEDSSISVVSFEKEQEMFKRFPRFERMCRIATEAHILEIQEKFATYISSSPEERYLTLLTTRPDLLNRVPQYYLASYLGIKPESLSRIRKRVSIK